MIHDKSICKECQYIKIDSYSLRLRHCKKCHNYGEKILKADITVMQMPVTVRINCPHCDEDIKIEYQDFTNQLGEPWDWKCSKINCPSCEKEIQIDNIEWD